MQKKEVGCSLSRKAQSSVEYIMIIGFLLIALTPLLYFAITQSQNHVRINHADDAMLSLSRASDTVYSLGPGSKKVVWITLPTGTSGTYILNHTIGMALSIFGGYSDIHRD